MKNDSVSKSNSNERLLPSILQFTELLLLRDEFRDICEWLWLCECDGLDSAERLGGGCNAGPANGLGVTVTIG